MKIGYFVLLRKYEYVYSVDGDLLRTGSSAL